MSERNGSATEDGTLLITAGQLEHYSEKWQYYRARYYDPSIGRFISEDPLEFGGGDVNLYAYVGNSPVSYIDPSGLGRLPANPTGLGPQWTLDPSHQAPNGSRWRNPNGDYLDFHQGQPGKPGWRGRDHWHDNGCPKHLAPGDEVPEDTLPAPPAAPNNTPDTPGEPGSGPTQQQSQEIQNGTVATGVVGTALLILYWLASAVN